MQDRKLAPIFMYFHVESSAASTSSPSVDYHHHYRRIRSDWLLKSLTGPTLLIGLLHKLGIHARYASRHDHHYVNDNKFTNDNRQFLIH